MNAKGNFTRVCLVVVGVLAWGVIGEISFAQGGGRVVGKITDRATKELLPSANVLVVGTSIGTTSDINGDYVLPNIAAGKQTLRVSFIGYKTKEVVVQVEPEQTTRQDVTLDNITIEVGEVTVSAQRQGQVASINRQLGAEALINAISSEKILQIPDANAAEAIGRLPGISMTRTGGEGSGVSIRGLSPKYSKITVNGVALPATDNVDRSTDLSMIAPENVAGIEVFKAITPDMDADAISGTVNLQLAKARTGQLQTVRLYGAYNAMQNDWGQFKGFIKSEGRYFDDLLGVQATVNIENRNRSADRLDATFLIGRETNGVIPIDINTASIQDRLETRKRWGASLILDYGLEDFKLMFANFYDQTDRDVTDRFHEYSNDRGKTRADVTVWSQRNGVLTNSLRAEGNLLGLEADASAYHAYAKNEMPGSFALVFEENTNLSTINRRSDPADFLRSLPVDSAAELREASYLDRLTTERHYGFDMNLKYPFDLSSDVSGFIKAGGKYRSITRENNRTEGLWPAYLFQKFYARDFLDPDYDPGKVLNGLTELGLVLDASRNEGFYNTYKSQYIVDNFWGNNDRYQTDERTAAGYLMAKINFGTLVTVIPGVRLESVDNSYTGYVRLQYGENWPYHIGDYHDTTTTQKYSDWLPMLHIKVKPVEWFDVRFAVTRTLSRPDFWDLVPYIATTTTATSAVNKGNPDLKPARSWNFDLYTSFYSTTLGLFTLGGFYKKIDDITIHAKKTITAEIAKEFDIPAHLGANFFIPLNVPDSYVKGFEVDLQTNLGAAEGLPTFLRGFVLSVNYTRMWSETYLPYYTKELVIVRPPTYKVTDSLRVGTVPSQSDHLVNLSLGYDIAGFSARVSMHYQTQSLDNVGVIAENDTFTDDFTRWDISLRQEILKNLKLYVSLVNVTNKPEGSYQYDPSKTSKIEYYGTMVDFGVQFEF